MRDKEIKKLIITQICIFIIFIGLGLIFNSMIHNQYKKELIKNNTHITANIIEKHPELENEIITNIIASKGNYDDALNLIDKYGLSQLDNLDYLSDVQLIKRQITFFDITFFVSLFLVISITYIIFFRRQYKKIMDVNKYMNNILNGNYSLDIRDYNEGYISNLKNDIYKITVRLKEQNDLSLRDKKNLENVLSDISHQIKTPLTSMSVINDVLSKDNLKPEVKKDFLIKNRRQLERIEWLVTTLLKLSRLENGSIVLKKEQINLEKLIDSALEPLLIPIELKKQSLIVEGDADIKIIGDYNWTLEAIINIIKNAYEHTPNNGQIIIKYLDNPLYTELNIIDNGEGIDPNDIKHIFERFYKGKSSDKESIGIGLNMAKKIIDMQNGQITVTSQIGEGTTFTIKFFKITF